LAVIADGLGVLQVASKVAVSRQTLHAWLARYEAKGLDGLKDRLHRPDRCPHQMGVEVEALVLELRRTRPYWGPRRLVFELADGTHTKALTGIDDHSRICICAKLMAAERTRSVCDGLSAALAP